MVLSKRERRIAWIAGSVVGLLILYLAAVSPYMAALADVQDQIDKAQQQQLANGSIVEHYLKVSKPQWKLLQAANITNNEAGAESNFEHDLLNWATQSQVVPQDVRGDQAKTVGKFASIAYHVTVTGSTKQIANLLWRLETATTIPVRLEDLALSPQPVGTDNLVARIQVSTLCTPDNSGTNNNNNNVQDVIPPEIQGAIQ